MIVNQDGEPIHVPDGWTTVELTDDDIEAEATNWAGKVNLDHVALHLLKQRGIRLDAPKDGAPLARCFTEIEQPVLVVREEDGITVHQGPRVVN